MKFKRDGSQEKVWADWLSDSVPEAVRTEGGDIRPEIRVAQKNRRSSAGYATMDGIRRQFRPKQVRSDNGLSQAQPTARHAQITLNLQLPDLEKFKNTWRALPWNKVGRFGAIFVGIVLLLWGGSFLMSLHQRSAQRAAASAKATAPSYVPLKSDTATQQGDTAATAYDSKKELYLFHDTYQGVKITVSQQPMPQSIKSAESKLADIAQTIGAGDKLDTTLGSVYYTKPDQDGSQRIVFTNKRVLVFAKSSGAMSNQDWVNYVQSLN